MTKLLRRLRSQIIIITLVVLITGLWIGLHTAAQFLKTKAVEFLGPDSEIQEVRIGLFGVTAEGVRIKAPASWPVPDALRADRINIVPSLSGLLSGDYRIHSISVVHPYVSALRNPDGRLQIIPDSLARVLATNGTQGSSTSAPRVVIESITLSGGNLEFFDASVTDPPLVVRLEQINAQLTDVIFPTSAGKTDIDLTGVVNGAQHDGNIAINGWIDLANKDSSLKTQLRSVDLLTLQPYLIKAKETGVRQGALDLDLEAEVRNNQMKAPGDLTLSDFELAPDQSSMGTFMSMPRSAVISLLKDKNGKITVSFSLDGNLNDPKFSLNTMLSMRLAAGLAQTLGVSLGGLVKGVGGTVEQLFSGNKKGKSVPNPQ